MSFENFTQVLQVFKAIIVKRIISLFEDISYALIIYHLPDKILSFYSFLTSKNKENPRTFAGRSLSVLPRSGGCSYVLWQIKKMFSRMYLYDPDDFLFRILTVSPSSDELKSSDQEGK